jgi:hypothetical protein
MKNNACTEVTEQISNRGRFRVGRDGLQPGFGRNLIAQDASQVVVRPVRLLGFAAVIFLMGVALLTPLCGWGQADGQFSVRRQSEQQQQAGRLEDDQEPDEPPDQTSQFLPQYNENRPSEPGSEMQPPAPFSEYENAPAAAPPQYPAHRNEDHPSQQQDGLRQATQQGGESQAPEPRVKAQPGKQIRGSGGSQQRRQRPMDQPQLQPPPLIPPPKLVNNPYPDNPALRDLYRQYRSQGSKTIERFGASLFRNGSGKPDKLPMDIPVGPDYVLGPGDTVMIDVSGGAPQRQRSIVDPEGRISLPGGGTLLVTGMTMESAGGRPDIAAKLHLIELPLYLGALWGLTRSLGIEGTAIAWAGRVTLDAALLFLFARRILPASMTFLPKLAAAVTAGLMLMYLTTLPQSLASKALLLFAGLLLGGATAWLRGLNSDERAFLRQVRSRRFGLPERF